MKTYQYLFYRLFMGSQWGKSDDNYSAIMGSIAIGTFPILNVLALVNIINIDITKKYSVLFFILLFVSIALNLIYFFHDKRYLEIKRKFSNETKARKASSVLFTLIYVTLSVVLPFVTI